MPPEPRKNHVIGHDQCGVFRTCHFQPLKQKSSSDDRWSNLRGHGGLGPYRLRGKLRRDGSIAQGAAVLLLDAQDLGDEYALL